METSGLGGPVFSIERCSQTEGMPPDMTLEINAPHNNAVSALMIQIFVYWKNNRNYLFCCAVSPKLALFVKLTVSVPVFSLGGALHATSITALPFSDGLGVRAEIITVAHYKNLICTFFFHSCRTHNQWCDNGRVFIFNWHKGNTFHIWAFCSDDLNSE